MNVTGFAERIMTGQAWITMQWTVQTVSEIVYDSNLTLDNILITEGYLQSVFDVYLSYMSVEKY